MKHARPQRPKQRGATLVVLLVMLVIVTLLTVSSLRSTTQEERMAGNSRDRDKAFQAAEAAVQTCLNQVRAGTFTGPRLSPVPIPATAPASAPNWGGSWADNTTSTAVTITGANLDSPPRCMVEDLGGGSVRVTGRAVGANPETVVMLQATYSTE